VKIVRFIVVSVAPLVLAFSLIVVGQALLGGDGSSKGISIWGDPGDPSVTYGVFVDENGCYSHIDVFSDDPDKPFDTLPGGCIGRPLRGIVAGWLMAGLFVVIVGALRARRTGYRWFHGFGLLVPVLGVVWYVKWAWRQASLPNRYWEATPPLPSLATG
jgi:hypothetical protein